MVSGPKLIILRGNSGSGKSTVARLLRENSTRKIALVGQDNIRRTILKEKDTNDAANISLIAQITTFALSQGYDVILEGILNSKRYGAMLTTLHETHPETYAYYFDVSFEETLRRHLTKPEAAEFGEKEMKEWYVQRDFYSTEKEKIIPEEYSLEQAMRMVIEDAGL